MAALPHDAELALQYKQKGNQAYHAGDYHKAQIMYTQALSYDETNPYFYTNRAMANLKIACSATIQSRAEKHFDLVIQDSLASIRIVPANTKAYFNMAQAQLYTKQYDEALTSAKKAHELCVEDVHGKVGHAWKSMGPITSLVLQCKKEAWNAKEEKRMKTREGLLGEMLALLEEDIIVKVGSVRAGTGLADGLEEKELLREHGKKVEELKSTFELAKVMGEEGKRRKVPDWCLDEITFSVMLDPVITKSGQSYDRASILEHLKRSQTDPITRAPLTPEDLIPNRVLRAACEDFLNENGWAADW